MNNISQMNSHVYPSSIYLEAKDKPCKKPSGIENAAAGAASLCLVSLVPIKKVLNKPFSAAYRTSISDAMQYNQAYKEAAEVAFKNANLADKGVKFVNAANLSSKEIKVLAQNAKSDKYFGIKRLTSQAINKMKKKLIKIKRGKVATYSNNLKTILINTEKRAVSSFYLMGHALNFNSKGFGKILSKLRVPGAILVATSLFVGAFKRKKSEGEQSSGIVDKTTTFIKDNVGKIALIGTLPKLLGDGLASIKGAKLAKPLLSKDAYKHLTRTYGKAWLTCAAGAAAAVIGTKLVSEIKDLYLWKYDNNE